MRIGQAAAILAAATIVLVSASLLVGMHGQTGGAQTASTSTNGLELRLSVSSSSMTSGQKLQIVVSEYNMLDENNNATAGNRWIAGGLSLGACGHTIYPFGVALYRGHYTIENVSQAEPLEIYPTIVCTLMVRLVTGYLFQPQSDSAMVLPSYGGSLTVMQGSVAVGGEYINGTEKALDPGAYTVSAGDEWGDVAFLYVTVSA